ncbi:hypothetical protein BGX26_004930 [Mortierella sp. AD094]|nr:hypothetical protein BGX26_004930 [Mortierella sp. AD094]
MSKSGAQSVSASASASASSYDPHSLPPNVKGLVQRYLAVSIPTITLTPEFIDVLDKSSILIPSKIKVTMRWWKEDTASSLSVFPKLNSPLPEAIEKRQNLLRLKQQQEKHQHQHQHQQQDRSLDRQGSAPQHSHTHGPAIPSLSSSNAQPSASAQAHHRSAAASFLRRPWSGARLLSVFRKGKKSKEHKAVIPDTAAQDVSTSTMINPTDAKIIDALNPTHVGAGVDSAEADIKPLPSLPESAFPITVAYPIRCSLDQLHRYFLEMTSLNLEIQITPDLSIITTVPNIIDLFRNINTPFSGVYPFSTVLQNGDPRLRSEKLFKKRVVLGMVVFQAWSQDTSDVGDDSDESDSVSTRSALAMPEENDATRHPHHSHRRQNSLHDQYIRSAFRPEQHTPPPQFPHSSQRVHPAHGPPHLQGGGQNPHNLVKSVNPAQLPVHQPHQHQSHSHQPHLQQRQHHHQHHQHHQQQQQGGVAPPRTQFPREQGHVVQGRPTDRDGYTPRISMHYSEDVPSGDHRTFLSRPYGAGVADDTTFRNEGLHSRQDIHRPSRERLSHSSKYHARQSDSGPSGRPVRNQSRYLNVRIPAPEVGPSAERPLQYDRYNYNRPTADEYFHDDPRRRSEETNPLNQSARSRPRASATAAAIGRLDSVLARGEDLLHGMRTSLALDPEEVRVMSARNIRSSVMQDDIDDDRYLPYHEVLPYWPSKSRFSLEMSIPTAYLTSRGLLKGSHSRKHTSRSTLRSRQERPPTSQRMDWERTEDSRIPHRQSPIPATEASEQQHQQQHHQHHIRRASSHYQASSQSRTRQPATGPTLVTAAESAPRLLRRSGRPIQFEKISPRSDLERLRLAQEESIRPRYQSFQTDASTSASANPAASRERFQSPNQTQQQQPQQQQQQQQQPQQQQQQQQQQRGPYGQQSAYWSAQNQTRDQRPPSQPRKSKSYPQSSSSIEESRANRMNRRRLSSHDRLQIRMNPKAGDLLNYIPGLFPSRSMSALIVPEYHSSLEGSSVSASNSSSVSTEDDEDIPRYDFAGDMGGRQSRLQKRPHRPYRQHYPEPPQAKRHQSQRFQQQRTQDQSGRRSARGSRVHPQRFNFKASCQLQLTPEVMAACLVENISVEVWKLNSKRQTMIELGSAKLPLHKVLSRIMQKTATTAPSTTFGSRARQGEEMRFQRGQYMGPRSGGEGRHTKSSREGFKEGWRLEPSVYEIRSRQGTVVGQLDADVWIHPRSRSDSMISAAA